VVRAAIATVGKLGKRRFVPRMLDRLVDPQFTPDVTEAISSMGERVLGALADHLRDPDVPIEARREIPVLLMRIGGPGAARILQEHLFETDGALRYRVICGLNKIRQAQPLLELDDFHIETVMAAEIMGHYRSYQILGTLQVDLHSDDPVAKALKETLEQETERIFRLLGLLFPKIDLHSAYYGVQSSEPLVHDNALEFLDNVLKPQIRTILVPLLDSTVSIAQRVDLANRLTGAAVQTREEAVAALVGSEDPWLKSCGAYAIGSLGLKSLEGELDSCLNHPDPLLRETARQAKLRLASSASSASSAS
jgi:AAA family ATP:ADP antiporter